MMSLFTTEKNEEVAMYETWQYGGKEDREEMETKSPNRPSHVT